MTASFNCPNCGAPLDYQGRDPIIRCPYCNSSVIVPENLRARPTFSSTQSNFTLSGTGDMGGLVQQALRIKEVKDLAEAGDFDRGVALYREITGTDEFSARQAVGALASGRPVTLTGGIKTEDVRAAVRAATAPGVHVGTLDKKSSRNIGLAVGCFVTVLTLTILVSVLVPVLGTTLGLFAAFNAASGDSGNPAVSIPNVQIPGIEVPLLPKFATQELSFGGEGTGPGLFGDVRAIAVDPVSGNIYAADYDGGRVQSFDAQGKFLTQWIVTGENDPYIADMAADRNGRVFVVTFGKILAYDGQGKPLGEIEAPDNGYFDSLDIAPDGTLWAISRGEDVVKVPTTGQAEIVIPEAVSSISGDSELGTEIAVDGLGNLYLLGTFNNAVFVYTADGKYVNRFGSDGEEPGQFRAPYSIEVDGQGRVFVSDVKGVQVFGSDGRYIDVIDIKYFAYGLAFDDVGKLYVTTNQKMVERYTVNAGE